jgi:SOS-response transcriptional repressor LexA
MAAGESSPIYDDLMRFKPDGMSPNAWAMKAGVSRTVWADMRRHGNPSRRTLEKLLTAAGSSLAEFEALRIGGTASERLPATGLGEQSPFVWKGPQVPPLPLVATAMAGEWGSEGSAIELTELRRGEIVDRLPRPASLANDPSAYAMTIVGDSMWPRFRPGRRVAVSPKAPVSVGDDVVVTLAGVDESGCASVLVKELVRRSGEWLELRQFNPDLTFRVPAEEAGRIEKVVGELI